MIITGTNYIDLVNGKSYENAENSFFENAVYRTVMRIDKNERNSV